MSELSDSQALFMECLCKFMYLAPIIVEYQLGYTIRLRLGEGYVGDSIDKPTEDTPHMRNGTHFTRTGIDLIVDIYNPTLNTWEWSSTFSPTWDVLGKLWKFLNKNCRWGGDFTVKDYNHFSLLTGKVA